ncbi:MAG: hypothetical protein JO263_11060 [Candidatus Eremiobacteraeota bacterium]|nr:hypothetical protein [Candidatus Eremiobacteraeota bacterium]
MKLRVAALCLLLTAELAAAPEGDLLSRMAAVNADLHSFSATLHAHVTLKSFPYLSADLVGTYYYKEPDKAKVVFSSGVPLVANQFDKLYAHIENPARWRAVYQVTLLSDDGTTSKFRLVPRKHGNVDHIDATADDKTATVTSMRWSYDNGGYAEMINRYKHVQDDLVVQSQSGHVEEPGYVADLSSTIDNYRMNPSLPDSLFVDQ